MGRFITNAAQTIVKRSTNRVTLQALRDDDTGEYPEDADVTFTLLDGDGEAVTGAEDVLMGYVDGTHGPQTTYRGTIADSVDLDDVGACTVVVSVTVDGATREINVSSTAVDG